GKPILRVLDGLALLAAAAALASTLALEARFHLVRHQVLNADPAALERLGRHLIVGYSKLDELHALIARRAVAGVFLSAGPAYSSRPVTCTGFRLTTCAARSARCRRSVATNTCRRCGSRRIRRAARSPGSRHRCRGRRASPTYSRAIRIVPTASRRCGSPRASRAARLPASAST